MLVLARLGGKTKLKSYLESVAGDLDLMILGTVSHGRLYRLLGEGPAQAQMFLVGNPLIALTMMRFDAEAGLYAPLRVMFWASAPDKTVVSYDRPSKMFGQWHEPVFQETGRLLDQKLELLIRRITE